eukprot:2558113-Pleurochrysis_carterae.AAC.1
MRPRGRSGEPSHASAWPVGRAMRPRGRSGEPRGRAGHEGTHGRSGGPRRVLGRAPQSGRASPAKRSGAADEPRRGISNTIGDTTLSTFKWLPGMAVASWLLSSKSVMATINDSIR